MANGPDKAEGAFRTIGEVARETGVAQHILRYWETRFSQLRPLQRAGNRRYYRPDDVVLVQRIDTWLNREGYTIRGVQQLLSRPDEISSVPTLIDPATGRSDRLALSAVRDLLARAIAEDGR